MIKKIIFLLSVVVITSSNANAVVVVGGAEAIANLAAAHAAGMQVYTKCILIPPLTKPQIAICEGLDNVYHATLIAAASPMPLLPNPYPSPYTISPFDICRFEPSVLVFPIEGGTPICPSF